MQVRLLGPVDAAVNGVVRPVHGLRRKAVLAVLGLHGGEVVSTDRIIDAVWGGVPPSTALNTVQSHVSYLRQLLGGRTVIVARPPGYVLELGAEGTDVEVAERLVQEGATAVEAVDRVDRLRAALALWRGRPLADLAGLSWVEDHVDRLDGVWLRATRCLLEARLVLGEHEGVVPELEGLTRDHPFDEELHRLLILALYRRGRQADALAAYRRIRRALGDELGIDPGRPLRDLQGAILRQDRALDLPAEPVGGSAASRLALPMPSARPGGELRAASELPMPEPFVLGGNGWHRPRRRASTGAVLARADGTDAPPPEAVLVGRDRELAAVDAAAAAAAGGFRIMWIAGEAGSGKSTLGAAVTSMLGRRGWATAWGGSPEIDGVPAGWAWADVVRQLVDGPVVPADPAAEDEWAEGLRTLLHRKGSALDPPKIAPFLLARAVVEVLSRATGPPGRPANPVLVLLDDVHRAGEETLQILRYAGTELADRPVLVVATFRPTEVSAVLEATRAALTGPRVDQLDLGGLGKADVGRVLATRTGAAVPPDIIALIATRTGGNPLFVEETARLIAAEGLDAATDLVPSGVATVLRRRLAALPAAALAVLRTAAVIGTEVDTELLLSLGPEPEAVLDALEAAIRAGLLTERSPAVARFSHVLLRDVLYQDIPQVRRCHLHAEVLTALERSRPADVAALAHHALVAATPATARSAATRARAAARAASATNAHQDATGLLTRALEVLDPADADPAEPAGLAAADDLRLDLLCALVSAQGSTGNVRAARAARDRAIQVAGRLGNTEALIRAYTAYDAPALWAMHEYQELDRPLVNGLTAALAAVPADKPATRCRLLAALAVEIEADDPDRTDRVSAEAVAIADRLEDAELLCRALNARYRYVATLGPDGWPELDHIGRRQLAVATAAGLVAYQTQAHHILGMACLARTDLERAQWHLDRAVEHATSGQLGLALGILAMFTGLRELITGRFDQAELTFARVLAQLKAMGNPSVAETELLVRFCIEHARQGPGTRERMAELAETSRSAYERLGDAVAEPYARVLIAAGQSEQARAVWKPHLAIARDHYWFRWTVLRAENALHLGDLATAATCYQQLLPWTGHLPGLLHAHITLGPVDHTLGDLATALGQPGAAARHYADAVAVAERIGAPHWAARSRRMLQDDVVCAGPGA